MSTTTAQPQSIEFGSAADVAAVAQVSIRQIHTLEKNDLMPAPARVGHLKRWNMSTIRQWLNAGAPDRSTWEALRRDTAANC